jgi:hypothetical protein
MKRGDVWWVDFGPTGWQGPQSATCADLNGLARFRKGSRRAGIGEPVSAVARTEPRPPGITKSRLASAVQHP